MVPKSICHAQSDKSMSVKFIVIFGVLKIANSAFAINAVLPKPSTIEVALVYKWWTSRILETARKSMLTGVTTKGESPFFIVSKSQRP